MPSFFFSSCLSASRICSLTPETGPCKAYMPRYFYNQTSGQCDKFIYGGCQGNSNNFPTFEICQEKCQTGENRTIIKFFLSLQHSIINPFVPGNFAENKASLLSHIWPVSGHTKDCLQLTAVEVRAYLKRKICFWTKKFQCPLTSTFFFLYFHLFQSLLPPFYSPFF